MIEHNVQRSEWERDDRYLQLVELAPDAILIHDDGLIVVANASAMRLAGATRRSDLVGKPIARFLDPPYLKSVQARLTDNESLEMAPAVRDTLRRVDGSEVEIDVRAVGFMHGGVPAAHLVLRDITERLVAERAALEVRESHHRVQHMESVGTLAGGVAHEINNMMGVVLGTGELMLREDMLPERTAADIRTIIDAARRAASMTAQLLAFSRRAFHRAELVDLAAAVRATEPAIRMLLGPTHHLEIVATTAPQVWVDRRQLEQVIINLALNARDAMPQGGHLTISAGDADLTGAVTAADGAIIPAGHYATLTVHDTGVGLDATTQARIFEPFFTTRPAGTGTGLGLAAAHGILAQDNGYITVASTPGLGATFTAYLPSVFGAEMSDIATPVGRQDAGPDAVGAVILVVDDEPALCALAVRALVREGFRVLQASDGGSALELVARQGPPQLLLTDLIMPGIGGVELVRRLRVRWPALAVLYMSGYSAAMLEQQGAGGTDDALLQKPFTPGELVASVRSALARAATPRASIE